jgi:hypothetical protein
MMNLRNLAKLGIMAVLGLGIFVPSSHADVLWGPRVGVGLDPEQLVFGVHFRPGQLTEDLYIQPNVEVGVGDDHTILSFALPLHYHFETDSSTEPYAGGGFSFGVDSHDDDNDNGNDDDDSEFEVSVDIVGGLEWQLDSGNGFLIELKLGIGELHTMELMTGWLF